MTLLRLPLITLQMKMHPLRTALPLATGEQCLGVVVLKVPVADALDWHVRKLKRRLVWVDPRFLQSLVNAKWDAEEKRCEVQHKLELLELQQFSSDHSSCYTS